MQQREQALPLLVFLMFSVASWNIRGCRIIVGLNADIVDLMLWVDLGFHKQVVRDTSWILIGDFNVALSKQDTFSGSSAMNSAMCEFKDCVLKIKVLDITSLGLHFTWNQKPRGGNGILKKLVRIMGNLAFVDNFPSAYAVFQPYRISYHSSAVLTIPNLVSSKPKPFKFYNFLTHKSKFLDLISSHWNMQVDLGFHKQVVRDTSWILMGDFNVALMSKMRALKKPFKLLLYDHGNFHERVTKLRHELNVVQKALDLNPIDLIIREEEVAYNIAFTEAKLDGERFLKQKAKVEWLEAGDFNSAYFHKTIKSQNQRSHIGVILDANNVEVTGSNVHDVLVNHFKTFFGNDMLRDELNIEDLFIKKVYEATGTKMVREISNEEVKAAMFDIGEDKALGPDGFTSKLTIRSLLSSLRNCGPPRCAFKVDIQKAYDMVDWSLNGDIHGYFKGKRGLRQDEFKKISGLVPSIPKSTVFFCNVQTHVKLDILNIIPFNEGDEVITTKLRGCDDIWEEGEKGKEKETMKGNKIVVGSLDVSPLKQPSDAQHLVREIEVCDRTRPIRALNRSEVKNSAKKNGSEVLEMECNVDDVKKEEGFEEVRNKKWADWKKIVFEGSGNGYRAQHLIGEGKGGVKLDMWKWPRGKKCGKFQRNIDKVQQSIKVLGVADTWPEFCGVADYIDAEENKLIMRVADRVLHKLKYSNLR
nr:hypothetical protein [Tanacetum cinerariifolium]